MPVEKGRSRHGRNDGAMPRPMAWFKHRRQQVGEVIVGSRLIWRAPPDRQLRRETGFRDLV